MSPKTQVKIIRMFRLKKPDGRPKYKLQEIADEFDISLSALHKLLRRARCEHRERGGSRSQDIPSARQAKIIRDYSQPGTTMEQVGRMNPRRVVINGKVKYIPISKSRVSKVIQRWSPWYNSTQNHGRGFQTGDVIDWAGILHIVVEYHNAHKGCVIDLQDGAKIKHFRWHCHGKRAKLVEAAKEKVTPDEVLKKYWNGYVDESDDRNPDAQSANGEADQRRDASAEGNSAVPA